MSIFQVTIIITAHFIVCCTAAEDFVPGPNACDSDTDTQTLQLNWGPQPGNTVNKDRELHAEDMCKSWCHDLSQEWSIKCGWDKCRACDECDSSAPTPSPTPAVHPCAAAGGDGPGELPGCCTRANPCPLGVGDCNSDDQCYGALSCSIHNQGHFYGYTNHLVDVCGHSSIPGEVGVQEANAGEVGVQETNTVGETCKFWCIDLTQEWATKCQWSGCASCPECYTCPSYADHTRCGDKRIFEGEITSGIEECHRLCSTFAECKFFALDIGIRNKCRLTETCDDLVTVDSFTTFSMSDCGPMTASQNATSASSLFRIEAEQARCADRRILAVEDSSVAECANLCLATDKCHYFAFNAGNSKCRLTETCQYINACTACTTFVIS